MKNFIATLVTVKLNIGLFRVYIKLHILSLFLFIKQMSCYTINSEHFRRNVHRRLQLTFQPINSIMHSTLVCELLSQ